MQIGDVTDQVRSDRQKAFWAAIEEFKLDRIVAGVWGTIADRDVCEKNPDGFTVRKTEVHRYCPVLAGLAAVMPEKIDWRTNTTFGFTSDAVEEFGNRLGVQGSVFTEVAVRWDQAWEDAYRELGFTPMDEPDAEELASYHRRDDRWEILRKLAPQFVQMLGDAYGILEPERVQALDQIQAEFAAFIDVVGDETR